MRTAWIGRTRAVALAALALAMAVDLTSLVALAGRAEPPPFTQEPGDVAVGVVRAVAEADCDGLLDLLAPDAALPYVVSECLRGAGTPVDLSRVDVASTVTDGGAATVVVEIRSAGTETRLEAGLRRDGDRWVLTSLAPVG